MEHTLLCKALDALGFGSHPQNRQQLAKLLKVSVSAVDHWYYGRNMPKIDKILEIQQLSGVDLTPLLPGLPNKPEDIISTKAFSEIRTFLLTMHTEREECLESVLQILRFIMSGDKPKLRAEWLLALIEIVKQKP